MSTPHTEDAVSQDIYALPPDLPVPTDDGGARHLGERAIPALRLASATGEDVDLAEATRGRAVLFFFPRAGSPLEPNTNQELWDRTPGARGCTPQSCGFRDAHAEFIRLGYRVYGVSIQPPRVLREIAERNALPFPLLSDHGGELIRELGLPTFTFEGERLIKRMAWVVEAGRIRKVFYPVFPPDRCAGEVLAYLSAGAGASSRA
jgi:peroxiredoxin